MARIYLDNAATSWPKPTQVYDAVDNYLREVGTAYGRGNLHAAIDVERKISRVRQQIAQLVGLDEPNRVIFTNSGTDSLNTAILGLVRPGDHVVTTVCEHNSVLRPLRFLSDEHRVQVTYVPCDGEGFVDPGDVRRSLKRNTRLVAVVHGSNVTGAIQPIGEIGKTTSEHNAFFLIDAAQTMGEVPLDMSECHADVVASPGHKGLLGPLGTGVLCLSERAAGEMRPLRFGGTGTSSEDDRQPTELPYKFEAGNLNVPGLIGLTAGVDYLQERGIDRFRTHHEQLAQGLIERLSVVAGVTIYGPKMAKSRTSVVSFAIKGYDPHEISAILEITASVESRAGLHCAPRLHEALGTLECGGTLRLSPGWFSTLEEIEVAVAAIEKYVAEST